MKTNVTAANNQNKNWRNKSETIGLTKIKFFIVLTATLQLFSCESFVSSSKEKQTTTDDKKSTPQPTYTVGGTVSNLHGTLILKNNQDSLTISNDGEFTFNKTLTDGSSFAVSMAEFPSNQNCFIQNETGNITHTNVDSVLITCNDKTWTHPNSIIDNISPDGKNAFDPQVALDNHDNAIIAWYQWSDTVMKTYKSEFRNNAWIHPTGISDSFSPNQGIRPKVAMNDNGKAIISWDGVSVREYENGSWLPSQLMTIIGNPFSEYSSVAIGPDDHIIVVGKIWDPTGGHRKVFKSEKISGGWTLATNTNDAISPTGGTSESPKIKMDKLGNAIVVWQQSNGNVERIFKSELRGGEWVNPNGIPDAISPIGGSAFAPEVAMNDKGEAIIVWSQSNGSINHIYKSEFKNGTWTHPTNLSDYIPIPGGNSFAPKVSMDNDGNAIIAFQHWTGNKYKIFKSERRSGVWTHPASENDHISPTNTYSAAFPNVAMDNRGNAIIIWVSVDGTQQHVYMSEFRNNTWKHPTSLTDHISPIHALAGGGAVSTGGDNLKVVMNDNGKAIIVWEQYNGANSQIFKSEYK